MAQPGKCVKRTVKLLVNTIALLCSVIVLVLVGATQSTTYVDGILSGGCALNVGAVGVCAYAYILGGIGVFLALAVIFLVLVACVTDEDAPVILDGTIHAFAAIWWIIGTIVLSVFVARANSRHLVATPIATSSVGTGVQTPVAVSTQQGGPTIAHPYGHRRFDNGNGARIVLVIATLANALLYSLSLWTNACCCIARHKHETVSMYV